jgi:catechol 2,3-dioxygenase-like lactoylglutathione lyase family enzyme
MTGPHAAPPRLDHANIVVADMDRSLAFYRDGLGLEVILDRLLDGGWFERLTRIPGARARCVILDAPGGGCRIELLAYEDGRAAESTLSHPATQGLRHLAIRVEDLDERLERLRILSRTEAEIVDVPRDIVARGKRMAYIHDPDGVLVELCAYAKPG